MAFQVLARLVFHPSGEPFTTVNLLAYSISCIGTAGLVDLLLLQPHLVNSTHSGANMMSGATTAGRASLPKRCGAAAALAYKICSGSLLLLLLLQALDGTGATAAATATTTSACDANPNAANRLSDARANQV